MACVWLFRVGYFAPVYAKLKKYPTWKIPDRVMQPGKSQQADV